MKFAVPRCGAGSILAIGLVAAALAVAARAAQGDAPIKLRVVGGLAGLNQYVRHEEQFWRHALPRLSGGRLSADIVPFDQAGIRGQEMLRLMQIGAVPFGTALLPLVQDRDPELAVPDLAGLNPDMKTLRRHFAALRPHLERILRERHGIEPLAIYVYPAQVTFCVRPFSGLADLAGRRVRVSNASQADLVRALGAVPVPTAFAEVVPSIRAGQVECAVTAAMSGNTIGLHEVTSHIDRKAMNWGLAVFGANRAAWTALPADARELLQRELALVERAIWDESDRETDEGVVCNTGGAGCSSGRRGRMAEVPASPADERRLREIFVAAVLPNWLRRCGSACVSLWNQTLAPLTGIEARAP